MPKVCYEVRAVRRSKCMAITQPRLIDLAQHNPRIELFSHELITMLAQQLLPYAGWGTLVVRYSNQLGLSIDAKGMHERTDNLRTRRNFRKACKYLSTTKYSPADQNQVVAPGLPNHIVLEMRIHFDEAFLVTEVQ